MGENVEKLKCPACGKEMVEVSMPMQNVVIDVCVNGCGGIYFDNREYSKFDEPHEDISPLLEILNGKEFQPVDQSLTRICPVCETPMTKNYSSANKTIEIDECYGCGGKFLDNGELFKIRNEYKTENERIEDVLKQFREDLITFEESENVSLNTEYFIDEGREKRKGIILGLLLGVLFALLITWGIYSYFYKSGV